MNILKRIKKHIRPYVCYHDKYGEDINFKHDKPREIIEKAEDKIEVGIQLKFKF